MAVLSGSISRVAADTGHDICYHPSENYIQQLDHTSFFHLHDKMMRGLRKRVEQLQSK